MGNTIPINALAVNRIGSFILEIFSILSLPWNLVALAMTDKKETIIDDLLNLTKLVN
ncbi:MAG TPA: hypothetical protein VE593_06160 [Nitrososphaeraceae archaeon]|nr:hypothetical protein [Nitrososphaeraceae archaeon]